MRASHHQFIVLRDNVGRRSQGPFYQTRRSCAPLRPFPGAGETFRRVYLIIPAPGPLAFAGPRFKFQVPPAPGAFGLPANEM